MRMWECRVQPPEKRMSRCLPTGSTASSVRPARPARRSGRAPVTTRPATHSRSPAAVRQIVSPSGTSAIVAPVRALRFASETMPGVTQLDPSSLPFIVQGYRLSQALYVIASLRIPDLLEAGELTAEELAGKAGAHPDRLRRVLRALAAEGVFSEDGDGRFGQTAFSRQLVGDSEARVMILGWRMLPETYGAFGALLHAVRTGATAFDHAYGTSFYAYLESNERAAHDYDAAMRSTIEA